MLTCTRRIQFCAGHRVLGHENKCGHLHGHNYVILIEACADGLDAIGRVIDFSVLKEQFGGWIDANWDHGFLVYEKDVEVRALLAAMRSPRQKVYVLPDNPTAENMAEYLLSDIGPALMHGTGVSICSVTVHETENCFAVARL